MLLFGYELETPLIDVLITPNLPSSTEERSIQSRIGGPLDRLHGVLFKKIG
jgi:hypothetical protein